jgi:formylmethanofuran dehydrogenase subunit E
VTTGIAVLDKDSVSVFEGVTVLDGGLELLGVGVSVLIVDDGAELVGVGVSVSVVDNEAELEDTRVLVMLELEAEETNKEDTGCVEVDREEKAEKDED